MRSQELQVQEGDIGDWWPLAGTMADIPLRADAPGRPRVYDPKGTLTPVKARVWHGDDYAEKPAGEWNTIECYALGGDAVFRLNGRTVNVLLNSRFREKGSSVEVPLKVRQAPDPVRRGRVRIPTHGNPLRSRPGRPRAPPTCRNADPHAECSAPRIYARISPA